MPTKAADVTGVILAGGQGQRMGGMDKGLQALDGRPLVRWVLDRLAPQVTEVLISANRNLPRYAELGCIVVPDSIPDFAGPLAGLHAALRRATTPLLATVPCDSPFPPPDLVARLHAGLTSQHADLAVASCAGRVHRAFCLARRDLLPQLEAFLASGGRKVGLWHASVKTVEIAFDDEAGAFANINTPKELRDLQTAAIRAR
jgi:molybdopterin-guanine dinucleotide biosynthesis protein A